jgi:predicted DNA-binding transcriptional regulator AlpA
MICLQEATTVNDVPAMGGTRDRIVSERATAQILGISPDTLRRLGRRGEGPMRRKLSPRRVGYKLSEVEAYRDGTLQESMPQSWPQRSPRRRRSARRGPAS